MRNRRRKRKEEALATTKNKKMKEKMVKQKEGNREIPTKVEARAIKEDEQKREKKERYEEELTKNKAKEITQNKKRRTPMEGSVLGFCERVMELNLVGGSEGESKGCAATRGRARPFIIYRREKIN